MSSQSSWPTPSLQKRTTWRPLSASGEMRIIFPSRMPTLRTASTPVSGSMTRPPSSTRSYCCADTMVVDNARKKERENQLAHGCSV